MIQDNSYWRRPDAKLKAAHYLVANEDWDISIGFFDGKEFHRYPDRAKIKMTLVSPVDAPQVTEIAARFKLEECFAHLCSAGVLAIIGIVFISKCDNWALVVGSLLAIGASLPCIAYFATRAFMYIDQIKIISCFLDDCKRQREGLQEEEKVV